MSKNDGGPAFPLTMDAIRHENKDFYMQVYMQGMTLRDYFAASIAAEIMKTYADCDSIHAERTCEEIFKWADAMLKERAK